MAFDWINEYLSLTETIRSPQPFKLWSAISVISSVLERRAWTVTDHLNPLMPNQYIILAGDPGSGKTTMVSTAHFVLSDLGSTFPQGIFIGPDNPTKASFLEEFEKSTKFSINGMGVPMYSAMVILCRELGVFLSKFERDFISDITDIYDNPLMYNAPRKSVRSAKIDAPTLNILAAATPGALADTIPEVAWSQGFTSRFIFIYGSIGKLYRDMHKRPKLSDFSILQKHLREFYNELHGEFIWDSDAADANRFWFNEEDQAPKPDYSRLVHYNSRRDEHLMKLSMISAVSAGRGLSVSLNDFRRAQSWLFEAEKTMPDIFRAMHQKSDHQLLADAHHWMYIEWSEPKFDERKPFEERRLWKWFEDKIPSEKISGHIATMEKTGRIRKAPGFSSGMWIPNSYDKFYDI